MPHCTKWMAPARAFFVPPARLRTLTRTCPVSGRIRTRVRAPATLGSEQQRVAHERRERRRRRTRGRGWRRRAAWAARGAGRRLQRRQLALGVLEPPICAACATFSRSSSAIPSISAFARSSRALSSSRYIRTCIPSWPPPSWSTSSSRCRATASAWACFACSLGEERVALGLELGDLGLELGALRRLAGDDALLLLQRLASQLGRQVVVLRVLEPLAVLLDRVDDVPAVVAIAALGLELRALERDLGAQLRRRRVGARLPRRAAAPSAPYAM